jgi:hypothetical protein
MKTQTAEEILNTYHPVLHDEDLGVDLYPPSTIIKAMKEYAEQALDLAADRADVTYELANMYDGNSAYYVVDKYSILSLKSQLS